MPCVATVGCGGPGEEPLDSGEREAGACVEDRDCDDGVFCDGREQCGASGSWGFENAVLADLPERDAILAALGVVAP